MSKRCITTRFYTDEPTGRNAWDKVQARQKRDHISCSQAIVALLNEHDESIEIKQILFGIEKPYREIA